MPVLHFALLLLAGSHGAVPQHEAQLLAADGLAFDELGRGVAVDQGTVVAGAPGDDGAAQDSGSAYVFVRAGTSWSEQAKLVAADPELDDALGTAVALAGDAAAFGLAAADDAGPGSGAVYVFARSGTSWSEEQKIVPADGAAGDAFGRAVALDGDTLAAGAPSDDDAGQSSGAVYVFTRSGTTWIQQAKLVPADLAALDFFGSALALAGDTLLAGAPFDDDGASNAGSVYVFTRSGTQWTQQAKLVAQDAAASDFLGSSVALDADTALAGAGGDDDLGDGAGSAYAFARSGTSWTQQAKLLAPDGAAGDAFGQSVAVLGELALAGAHEHDGPDVNRGAVYAFARDGTAWSLRAKLAPPAGHAGQRFGVSVALEGTLAVAGTSPDVHAGADPGSASVFALVPAVASFCDASDGAHAACPCGNAGSPDAGCDNAAGTGGVALDVATYAPDAAGGGTAGIEATGFAPAGSPAVVLARSGALAPAPLALGDGVLCLGAGLVRLRALSASNGALSHTLHHAAGAGTFHYQLWYRSQRASFCTSDAFNLSSGATIVWP